MNLRADASACLRAAVAAVEPEALTARFLERHPECLPGVHQIAVAAIGKAVEARQS